MKKKHPEAVYDPVTKRYRATCPTCGYVASRAGREPGEQGFGATHDTLGQAAQGLAVLHRLVPASDHGAGFVYYSSEWLDDDAERERTP